MSAAAPRGARPARALWRALAGALQRRLAARGGAAPLRLELELLRRARAPARVEPPAVQRALILAPHMDDEVLGCGATAAALAARGCAVDVIFLTDGSKGYAGAPPAGAAPRSAREVELAAVRREESRRAGKRLGWSELVFLDLPDGALAVEPHAVEALARALARARPELVFLPFVTDLHPDHRAAGALFAAAARRARLHAATPCWAYEVWQPLPANALVDVGATMPLKLAALAEFASQNGELDYPRACEGLARYRSLLAGGGGRGFAEAFFTADLALYTRLCEAAEARP